MKVASEVTRVAHVCTRRTSFPYIKKFMAKSRQWVVLESSVGVLRMRKWKWNK
jgi:hypothetical protein